MQLQDETGRAFAGFSAEDCEPIVEDALDVPVRWRGSGDVRSLIGKMVALQFSFLPGGQAVFIYATCGELADSGDDMFNYCSIKTTF